MSRFGSNYVFNKAHELGYESENVASMKGVAFKTIFLLGITIITGLFSMMMINVSEVMAVGALKIGYFISPLLTFILTLIMSFNPKSAKILSIPYAMFEGFTIGSLGIILIASLGMAEAGLILGLALLITVAIFMGGAVLYTSGKIRVTSRFRRIMYVLLLGVVITTFVIFIASIFNQEIYWLFFGTNSLSLIISIIMIVIASVYTVISLDNANIIVSSGLDKNYEWYASFGIVLNIIWLFYEVVRFLLIIISRSRD